MKTVPYKKDNLHSAIDYTKLIKIDSMIGEMTQPVTKENVNKALMKKSRTNRRQKK